MNNKKMSIDEFKNHIKNENDKKIIDMYESRDWELAISFEDFKISIINKETFEECINRIRSKKY